MQQEFSTHRWALTNLRPLLPLEFFAVAQGKDVSDLIDSVDSGTFGHAWDIGCHSGSSKHPRRELRIFFLDGLAILNNEQKPDLSYDDCIKHIVPAGRGLKGTELQRLWICGPDLIHDLDAAGQLAVERDRLAQKGPRASRLYSRESIVAFLQNRAIGHPRKN